MTQGVVKAKMREITGITLKELDRLHERTEAEELEDFTEENGVLRLKLKILNEYLSKVVDTTLTSNNLLPIFL